MKKGLLISICAVAAAVYAQSDGEKMFKSNNPSAAVPLLEQEAASGNVGVNTFNFLGLAYFQLGNYNMALQSLNRGMGNPVSDKKLLAFNAGDIAYTQGDYQGAERYFSIALSVQPDFYEAMLNRANTRLMANRYQDAATDYRAFLAARPSDAQADNIRRILAYLEEEVRVQDAEKSRLTEAQTRQMQEELNKQKSEFEAADALRKSEEELKRRQLIEDIAHSLKKTESTNITAGAESVIEYEYESELE